MKKTYEVSQELSNMVSEINNKLSNTMDFIDAGKLLFDIREIALKGKVWGKVKKLIKNFPATAIDYAVKAYISFKSNHEVVKLSETEAEKKISELCKSIDELDDMYYEKQREVTKCEKEVRRLNKLVDSLIPKVDLDNFISYYKKLAKYVHPDKMGGNTEAMQLLNEVKSKFFVKVNFN